MCIETPYRKPNTSRRQRGNEIHLLLLREFAVERPNHVYAADITCILMRRSFPHLFAAIDWYSRRVLAWRLSNTLTTDFCLNAVRDAIHRHGCPEVRNTDQGCQSSGGQFAAPFRQAFVKSLAASASVVARPVRSGGCLRRVAEHPRAWCPHSGRPAVASEFAGRCGVAKVAVVLKLDHANLKLHSARTSSNSTSACRSPHRPAFRSSRTDTATHCASCWRKRQAVNRRDRPQSLADAVVIALSGRLHVWVAS